MADIIQTFPKGTGSGGGHTILDTDGTAVTQEKNLQFTGLSVTDDSTNEVTKVAGEGLNADSIDDIADASSIVPAVIIGDSNNFSTNEKIIGKWVDGKPLYQKTVYCGIGPKGTYKQIAHNISNIEFIVDIRGTAVRPSDVYSYPIPLPSHYNLNYCLQIAVDNTNITLDTGSGADFSAQQCYITIKYTKTTD